jgi:hypothetical protein
LTTAYTADSSPSHLRHIQSSRLGH